MNQMKKTQTGTQPSGNYEENKKTKLMKMDPIGNEQNNPEL